METNIRKAKGDNMSKINLYGITTEYGFLPSREYALGSHHEILKKYPKHRLTKKQRRKIRAVEKFNKE